MQTSASEEQVTANTSLLPFVPEIVRRQLRDKPALHERPFEESFRAAVLFADISGFTPLAERLSEEHDSGAERVGDVLTACFGQLIELISAYGGEVFKFAGDATVAFWIGDLETDLKLEALQAVRCASEIQSRLDHKDVDPDTAIRLRISVAAGPVRVLHVGGVSGRWECVVAGEPLAQIATAQSVALPGQVVLSQAAADLVRSDCVLAARANDLSVLERVELPDHSQIPATGQAESTIDTAALRAYVPRSVTALVDAGQTAWLAEFRRVTTMFVGIGGIDYRSSGALDQLQSAVAPVQEIVYEFEGSINQLIVEDKGTTLIAAWGQVLHSHADDSVRALRAARRILEVFQEQGRRVSIGVTAGRLFTGVRGNAHRSEFGLIGNVVNLSARLMMSAKDSILCDSEVRMASRRDFIFKSFAPRTFKGVSQPVAVFSPLAERKLGGSRLIGRQAERTSLRAALTGLEKRGESAVRLLVGDAGIGKSRLVQSLLEQTQASPVRSLVGAGDSYERSSAYYPWRAIVSALFGLGDGRPAEADRQTILGILDREPGLGAKAPLLNDLFEFGLDENETTKDMTSKGRAEGLRDVLVALLNHAAQQSPTMLVIEDAHWIDSTSWTLAAEIVDRVHPLCLVMTMRPMPQEVLPVPRGRIADHALTNVLHIDPLSDDESLALACNRLDVDSLPEEVVRLVREKAEGHPFFTEQFVLALRDQQLVEFVRGECRIAESVSDLQQFRFPNDVQGVVMGRIDQLPTTQQLTLKVASVVGREFDVVLLSGVHPLEVAREELLEQLRNMVQLELVSDVEDAAGGYRFNHSITQDVAYELLPFSQRKEFHRRVGEWIERHLSGDASQDYSLLAYHWTEADQTDKAVEYLEKAGDGSLARDANKEAIQFFEKAIAVAAAGEAGASVREPGPRFASWHRKLGDAHWKLGDTEKAIEQLRVALRLLGFPIAESRGGKVATLLRETSRQAWSQAFSGSSRKVDEKRHETLLEASRAAGLLAWIFIVRQDSLGVMYASLLAANLADKANRTSVLSNGILGYSAYSIGLRRLARKYFDRAKEKGVEQNDLAELAMMQVFDALTVFGNGDVEGAGRVLAEAGDTARKIGDRILASRTSGAMSSIYGVSGEFDKARACTAKAFAELKGEPSGDTVYLHLTDFHAEVFQYKSEDLLELPDRYVPKIHATIAPDDLLPQSCLYGVLALMFLRAGRIEQAVEHADEALDLLGGIVGMAPTAIPPYRYPLEVYLAAWASLGAQAQATPKRIVAGVRRSLKHLRGFAKVYPVHRSRLSLYLGRMAWLQGKHDRARSEWRRALDAAVESGMVVDEGLALLELVRTANTASDTRAGRLRRAVALFRELGFPDELSEAEALQR